MDGMAQALRHILEVVRDSRDDELPVFDAILENASCLCHAPIAGLALITPDGAHYAPVAHRGMRSEFFEYMRANPPELNAKKYIAARAMVEMQTVHVEDIADPALYGADDSHRLQSIKLEGMRTAFCVPLISKERCVGGLFLYRREVARFSDEEIALVEMFAAQAVIAIENVRQFREVRNRLERERASGEILEVISQSRDDEMPVFERILERAAKLCDAPTAGLQLVNEERTRFGYVCKWGEDRSSFKYGETWPLDTPLMVPTAIREARVIHNPDISDDPVYRSGDPTRVRMVEKEGIRTYLVVPLVRGDAAIGSITLTRREVRPFSDDEISLVKTFAAQAVIAIENVHQFREVQNANAALHAQLDREKASGEVLAIISKSRDDYSPVFNCILENAARLCDAPVAGLHLVNEERTHHRLTHVWGADPGLIEVGEAWELSRPLQVSTCIREARLIHTPDLKDDPLYEAGDPIRRHVVDVEGVRTFLSVPLVKDGIAFGCFNLNRPEVKPFSDADIQLLEIFADQAVIAIENVRQFKELEDLNTELGNRVEEQVAELERMGKLKRFLPAAVADTVVSSGSEKMLSSHRALLGVLFCDIRGFTAFCETAEPEETIEVLQTYHQEMGKLINSHGAGVDHRMGDGIMVLFNDPLPCEDPAGDAVRLAVAMRARMAELSKKWKRLGYRLGFGVGVSLGYATVGMVGYEGRFDYTASGTAVNLAARLCDEADDGEILLSPRAAIAVEDNLSVEIRGELSLKGIRAPVEVFRLADPSGI